MANRAVESARIDSGHAGHCLAVPTLPIDHTSCIDEAGAETNLGAKGASVFRRTFAGGTLECTEANPRSVVA